MTRPRIVYIHGNGARHWSFAWAPWLKRELEARGFETFFETFPDSVIARAEHWLPFLREHVRAGEDDVLVGWSSGAVAAMRYAEAQRIRGSVLVAPCVTDLGIELEKQSGWYDAPWDWDAIRANQERTLLVHGDDDPFIPQEEFATIARELRCETRTIPGAGHFATRAEMPEVLEHILAAYGNQPG